MSNILSHEGNADQNITESPSHPSRNAHNENKQHMLTRIWKNNPYTLLVGMEVSALPVEISMEAP
jgi:hypothetical protein